MLSLWEVPDPIDMIVDTPTIGIVNVTLVDTEQPQVLPEGTKKFLLKVRSGRAELQVAYVAGEVGSGGSGNYITIPKKIAYEETNLDPTVTYTLYIASNTVTTLEVLSWA